jgi:hypothetical protein
MEGKKHFAVTRSLDAMKHALIPHMHLRIAASATVWVEDRPVSLRAVKIHATAKIGLSVA